MKRLTFLQILFFAGVLYACTNKGEVVAKVYDEKLYEGDIEAYFIKSNLSFEDSIQYRNKIINDWVNQQVVLHEANQIKDFDFDAIELKVNEYRNTLIRHQYENLMITEKLDTIISEDEYKAYYLKNKSDFQLNDYIVKVLYLKIPSDAPDVDKVDKWYKLNNITDILEIENYAKLYADNFYYDTENWIYFEDLTKEIPLHDINKDKFITRKSNMKFEEAGYYYFLNIIDYKLKNTISPLNFEKNKIKERILQMRINEIRKNISIELTNKANEKNAIKIQQ